MEKDGEMNNMNNILNNNLKFGVLFILDLCALNSFGVKLQVSSVSDFIHKTMAASSLASTEALKFHPWRRNLTSCWGQVLVTGLKESFSELNETVGIYAQLNHQDEAT